MFLDWRASLLTWDVLFLIPVPWVGPVLATVSVALTMSGMGLVLLSLEQRGPVLPAGTKVWLAQIVASLIIIVSFTMDVVPRLPDQGALLAQWAPLLPLVDAGVRSGAGGGTFSCWAWRASSLQGRHESSRTRRGRRTAAAPAPY